MSPARQSLAAPVPAGLTVELAPSQGFDLHVHDFHQLALAARGVADALLADVTDDRSLDAWGRAVGASGRTLARLFAAETGMGFERWRTTARLAAALPPLAGGMAVGATARQVGYATPSAFVAAFRREIGTTPAEYFRPN